MKLNGVMAMFRSKLYQSIFVLEHTSAFSSPASFSCSAGFKLLPDSSGCGKLTLLPVSLLIIDLLWIMNGKGMVWSNTVSFYIFIRVFQFGLINALEDLSSSVCRLVHGY